MSDEPRPLAPGALPLAGADVEVAQPLARVGDGLVYLARDGERQARLREYAPRRVVRRLSDGTLQPADPRFASAWVDGSTRFLEQGHRLASIDHPGIAPVWRAASVEADGVRQGAYLIGAPVGEPLSEALAGGLRLSPAAIVALAAELGEALAELHARGLTHLDIAPDTVSLASGRLELTDFAVDNRPFMPLLESQQGLVRPGYSPIEHHDASMAEPLGAPADVYAASALLFRLITGHDPAPWQERWRDPAAARLPDIGEYPPDMLAAIRRGMEIEPQDRFRDGAEWAAAMALPPIGAPVHAPPPPPPPPVTPPIAPVPPPVSPAHEELVIDAAPRRRKALIPILIVLAAIVIAVGGFLAYTQRWFVPAEEGTGSGTQAGTKVPTTQRPAEREETPEIAVGASIAGQLGGGDRRRGGGQYEDRFILNGRAGERLEISVASPQFDPLLTVTGPGFQAANDDAPAQGSRDARLRITLPRAGRYVVAVSSYSRGAAGNYLLQVQAARPAISITTPAMLSGRWRRTNDPSCASPAVINVEGDQLVIDYNGSQARERILDGVGRVIRTRRAGGQGAERGYRLSDEADRFDLDNGTWVRC